MCLASAKEEGRLEGRLEGLEQGIEQGIEQGLEQGIKNTAKSMLDENINIETISKCTGLSEEEIKSLE